MSDNSTTATLKDDNVSEILAQNIPYKLGKYEIHHELGRGTCGVVYKGFDPFVRRDVAIKVGWADTVTDGEGTTNAKLDFFSEAHAAGRLQHPNIVSVYDAQFEKELNYIVMEYVEGETLLEYCRKDGKRLAPAKVLECMFKCCLALDFSHQMGVIHRDIKPSNIMLSRDGETKLMDFSVAEVAQNKPITPSMIVGSPSYMSPEQILRRKTGPASDLYSLAAVMYQLLAGERLYHSGDVRQVFHDVVHKPPPRLRDKRPDLPAALSDIIEKALRKNPHNRFESGREMAAELTAVYDNLVYSGQTISQDQQRTALERLRFFSGFEKLQLGEIVGAGSVLRFKAGELVSREGDIDNSFYIIVQGVADVSKAGKPLVCLNQGDCFGEIGFLAPDQRTTTITARTDAILLKINAARLEALSVETRMLFYKAFSENLIYRLSSGRATG